MNFQPFERLLRYKKGTFMACTYPSPVSPKYPPGSESRFLILAGNLFQVENALKSKVFTAKTLPYFLYNGKADV